MENKVVFVDGVNVYTPSSSAPEWVKANMTINATKLMKWLNENDEHLKEGKEGLELRLQIKQSTAGKLYVAVDTFEPKLKEEVKAKAQTVAEDIDSLPF